MNGHPRSAACVPVYVPQNGNATRRALARLLCLLLILCVQVAAQERDIAPGAYLFVIDRSGSMNEPAFGVAGKTRWQVMHERAVEYLQKVPLGSYVWLALFEGNVTKVQPREFELKNEDERKRALEFIGGLGRPNPRANTALDDTRWLAFVLAERLLLESPRRHVVVLTYSDGMNDPDKDSPKSPKSPAMLQERFKALVAKGYNIEDFEVHLEKEGVPLIAPVVVTPASIQLESPRAAAEADVQFRFKFWDSLKAELDGQPLDIQFVPDAGEPIQAVVVGVAKLSLLPVSLKLRVTNAGQLPAAREYHGRFVIKYPQPKGAALRVGPKSGQAEVRVTWQATDEPRVDATQLRPADGSVFPVGRKIHFHAPTLTSAKLEWDFGDGQQATGADIEHAYDTPGDWKVRVTMTTKAGLTASGNLNLRTAAIRLAFDGTVPPIFAGQTARIGAKAEGLGGDVKIEDYVWQVDGAPFAGQARADGLAGSELIQRFDMAGTFKVTVTPLGQYAPKPPEPVTVRVYAVPRVVPVDTAVPRWGKPLRFRLEHEPESSLAKIEWDFGDGKSDASGSEDLMHAFTSYGDFSVSAKAVGKNGQPVPVEARTIKVEMQKPAAVPRLLDDRGRELHTCGKGQVVTLDWQQSSGDIIGHTWMLDGKELPANDTSVVVPGRGEHTLTLRVTGPEGAGSDEKTARFTTHDRMLRLLIWLFAILTGCVSFYWLVWKNSVGEWRLSYGHDPKGVLDPGTLKRNTPITQWWSRWRKCAVLRIADIDGFGQPYWLDKDGKDVRLTIHYGGAMTCNVERPRGSWRDVPTKITTHSAIRIAGPNAEDPAHAPHATVLLMLDRSETRLPAGAIALWLLLVVALACLIWFSWYRT